MGQSASCLASPCPRGTVYTPATADSGLGLLALFARAFLPPPLAVVGMVGWAVLLDVRKTK